jgi:hypothetical protein
MHQSMPAEHQYVKLEPVDGRSLWLEPVGGPGMERRDASGALALLHRPPLRPGHAQTATAAPARVGLLFLGSPEQRDEIDRKLLAGLAELLLADRESTHALAIDDQVLALCIAELAQGTRHLRMPPRARRQLAVLDHTDAIHALVRSRAWRRRREPTGRCDQHESE